MRLPRMTTRRLIIVVAVLAVCCAAVAHQSTGRRDQIEPVLEADVALNDSVRTGSPFIPILRKGVHREAEFLEAPMIHPLVPWGPSRPPKEHPSILDSPH
jgi:hypothetical protein